MALGSKFSEHWRQHLEPRWKCKPLVLESDAGAGLRRLCASRAQVLLNTAAGRPGLGHLGDWGQEGQPWERGGSRW